MLLSGILFAIFKNLINIPKRSITKPRAIKEIDDLCQASRVLSAAKKTCGL
jgi:hypothetical protein